MADIRTPPASPQFTMICLRCDRAVLAREDWAGREVQCPHCSSKLRVPPPPENGQPVKAKGPSLRPKRYFYFACPRCDCLLESHTGMCGEHASCPTCAARFEVPFLRPSGTPERARLLEGERGDPTPVHAYAASGFQAPRIVHLEEDQDLIECPKCAAHNPIEADRCSACGTPFTIEAAVTVGRMQRDSRAMAGLILGIIGLLLFPTFLPGLLAAGFGGWAAFSSGGSRPSGMAIAGLVMGVLSICSGVAFWVFR